MSGVVVEEVGRGTTLEKAGLQAGDLVLAWQRPPTPPANPHPDRGAIETVFDWRWLMIEQAPRGRLELVIERRRERKVLDVAIGPWRATVRPSLREKLLPDYLEGRELATGGKPDRAVATWRRVAEGVEQTGDWHARSWLALRTGRVWAKARAWEKAEAEYRSALAVAKHPRAQVAIRNALGSMYLRQSVLDKAWTAYHEVHDLQRKHAPGSLGAADSLNNLGIVAVERSELSKAGELFRRALTIRQKLAPGSLSVAGSLNNLGGVALERGDLVQATDWFQRALTIKHLQAPGSLDFARSLNNLGIVADRRGDLEHAADLLQQALAILEKEAPKSLARAAGLTNLGRVVDERGDLDRAAELFQRALAIQENVAPSGVGVAASLIHLGKVAQGRGDLDRAAELFQRALEVQERLAPQGSGVAYTVDYLGGIARERGDLDLAADLHHRALRIWKRLAPGSWQEAETLEHLARVYRDANQAERSLEHYLRSVDALETQIGRLGGTENLRADFRARHGTKYRQPIELLLDLNRPEDAFALLERSRARSFLALLAERDLLFDADLPTDLDRERRRLAVLHDRALHRLAGSSPTRDPEEIAALRKDLRSLRQQFDDNTERIRRASPRLAALRHPRPLDLREAGEALDRGTVLLSYSVGEERTDLFVVSRDRELIVETLDVGEEGLRRQVQRLRYLIAEAGSSSSVGLLRAAELQGAARRLYAALIEPVAEALEASDRVLLVPGGPLHLLPFGALQRPDGMFLAEWKPLHSALSATVYAELKKSRPRPHAGERTGPAVLIAFGDPRYPEGLVHGASQEIADVRVRSAVERDLFDWSRLPFTRLEVERIAGLYPSPATRAFLGEDATEERAKATGGEADVVHFAAHGYLDDHFPLSSGLALTIPEELPSERENGLLQVWEIFESLRLETDLVVLSACQTGLGREQGGEGLIGLTRAFHYAGARTVAASLWSVNDRASAELMVLFHRYLRAGKTKDEALRRAQIELIRGPVEVEAAGGEPVLKDWSAPYYWAAFQIYGDWQ